MNQRFCSHCGEELVPGAKFCPGCGRVVGQSIPTHDQPRTPVYTPPVNQTPFQPPVAQQISKKQYRKVCTNEKYLKDLKSSAIALYILTALNAVLAFVGNIYGLIDVAIYLVLTLGMHKGKSKACAIGVLLYAIFSIVVVLAMDGTVGGWLWIIAAIGGIKAFSVADKEYEFLYHVK